MHIQTLNPEPEKLRLLSLAYFQKARHFQGVGALGNRGGLRLEGDGVLSLGMIGLYSLFGG